MSSDDSLVTAAVTGSTLTLTPIAQTPAGAPARVTVNLFGLKVARWRPPVPLAQLQQLRYADKYRAAGDPVRLIGDEFSRATRNINAFETADA